MMLALLWAPITSHCQLERVPSFEFLSCCTHDADECADKEKDCETDSCAVVEEGSYKVQDNDDAVPAPTLAPAFLLNVSAQEQAVAGLRGELFRPGLPPSTLEPSWRFSYRTAVAVRAPSRLA